MSIFGVVALVFLAVSLALAVWSVRDDDDFASLLLAIPTSLIAAISGVIWAILYLKDHT